MPFTSGTQIGPYRVMEQLGQGGMATVYKAYHASLDRYVAIKVLHQAFMEDPNFQARFQREARLVARLEHPNIVPIYDYAEHEGQPYLVMKFIEGQTLKARLQQGPLNATEVQDVVETVGAALAYAHKQGILHRDIKPSNVILSKDGNIYLADFGLARIAQSGESTLTSDMVLGTPQYISPEQAQAKKNLDEGTDIYSFGVMLYEMTVGRVPFSADTPFSVIHDHIYAPLPLPSSVNPKISPELERLLLKALAKERSDRYPDVPAFVEAFKQAWKNSASTVAVSMPLPVPDTASVPVVASQASSPLTMPAAPGVVGPSPEAPAAVSDTGSQDAKKKSRSRWIWIAIALTLCLCCLVVFLGTRGKKNQPTSPADAQTTLTAVVASDVAPTVQASSQTEPPAPDGEKIDLIPIDLAAAKNAVDQRPEDPKTHLVYGFALLQNNQQKDGYTQIHQAADLGAKNPAFLTGAGRALDKADLPLGAAIMYLQIAANGKSRNLPGLGLGPLISNLRRTVYYGFGEQIAPEVLDYNFISNINRPLALIAQARNTILYGNDTAPAQKMIDELRTLDPGTNETNLLQAELFIVTKQDIPGARKLLQGVLNTPNTPDWIATRAKELLKNL